MPISYPEDAKQSMEQIGGGNLGGEYFRFTRESTVGGILAADATTGKLRFATAADDIWGVIGQTGAKGATGLVGAAGATGVQGHTGVGATGIQGQTGIVGQVIAPLSFTGAEGITGAQAASFWVPITWDGTACVVQAFVS